MASFISKYLVFLIALPFLPTALAAPQLLNLISSLLGQIPILSTPPPAALFTKNPSPQCAKVNQGTLLCCESTLNGDIPIIVELAQATTYKLNPNSINCIYGKRNFTECSPGTQLCCQVDALATIPVVEDLVSLALYCQNAPGQT